MGPFFFKGPNPTHDLSPPKAPPSTMVARELRFQNMNLRGRETQPFSVWHEDNNSTYLTGLLQGLKELLHVKSLKRCLTKKIAQY